MDGTVRPTGGCGFRPYLQRTDDARRFSHVVWMIALALTRVQKQKCGIGNESRDSPLHPEPLHALNLASVLKLVNATLPERVQ
jgi:hypothetical protein